MKVAVIGVGGSGSAALRFLSAAGHDVTGFERFSLGHALGSSHGTSRLIRRTYPDAFHTALMDDAYRLWDDLEKECDEELLVRSGGITFGPTGDPQLEATEKSLLDAGIGYEKLDRSECSARFPAIDIGNGSIAIFQKDSGFLRADRCLTSQVASAKANGARIREHCPVLALEENAGKVFVSTAGETEAFDAAIVTAGPWAGGLFKQADLPLKTALRQVVYLAIDGDPQRFAPSSLPVWIEHPSDFYGFPSDGVTPGIKIASHHAGRDFDPDEPDRPVMEDALRLVRDHAMKRFPGLSGEILSSRSCLYTITPDERFIVDFASRSGRLVVCSGCSGHGFKFTVLLGKIAAEMATSGKSDPKFAPWTIGRFR